ncbi:MAG: lysophospholipid acyltransferase family protein [Janthinobacterium lividum]
MRISKQFWQGAVRGAFWAAFKILRHVPWKPALAWGTAMGTLGYHVSARFRDVADKNLQIAYGSAMTEPERQALIKCVFQQFARASLVEFLKGADFTLEDMRHWVKVDSYAPADVLLSRGKGVIVVSAHFGNWEWLSKRAAMEGYSVKVVARQSEDEKFNRLTDKVRGENGYTVHPRGDSPRALLKQLRENKIIAIVPDQKSEDVFVPYFGKLAGTVAGPAVLALKTGAAILPMFCPRQPDGTYKTVFYPAIIPEPTGDTDADVKRIMTEITADIEDIVRQYPDQWLWLHDRWRVPPPETATEIANPYADPATAH